MPAKLLHDHENISDAHLVAVALLQRLHKAVYFRHWWRILKLNHFAWFPSETQARLRLARLTPVIERLSALVQKLDFVVVDAEPLPVSTFKRAPRCKFPGTAHGFGTPGPVYGFKLHVWTTFTGKIARYEMHPANLHDCTVGCIMNRDWPAVSGPKQIGDNGSQSGTYLTPPKNNAKQIGPRWEEEYAAARKIIESTF